MRRLLFFSRVAFICNLFFVVSALLQWRNFIGSNTILSTVVILGYFMAVFVFNPLVNIFYLIQTIRQKQLFLFVPRWLVLTNFIFLLIQLIFILFFLNDTLHY